MDCLGHPGEVNLVDCLGHPGEVNLVDCLGHPREVNLVDCLGHPREVNLTFFDQLFSAFLVLSLFYHRINTHKILKSLSNNTPRKHP